MGLQEVGVGSRSQPDSAPAADVASAWLLFCSSSLKGDFQFIGGYTEKTPKI